MYFLQNKRHFFFWGESVAFTTLLATLKDYIFIKYKLTNTSINNSFLGDDKLIIDSGADDDFEEIDEVFDNNVKKYITTITLKHQVLPNNLTSIIEYKCLVS